MNTSSFEDGSANVGDLSVGEDACMSCSNGLGGSPFALPLRVVSYEWREVRPWAREWMVSREKRMRHWFMRDIV